MNSPLILAGALLLILLWIAFRRRAERTGQRRSVQWESAQSVRTPEHMELPATVEEPLRELLAHRNKIAAIKLVRAHTTWSLKQAKQYVEWRLDPRRHMPEISPPVPLQQSEPLDLEGEVRRLVASGQSIDAVKLVRERTGCSLQEAVSYVRGFHRGDEES